MQFETASTNRLSASAAKERARVIGRRSRRFVLLRPRLENMPIPFPDDFSRAEEAAQFVFARTSLRPRIALVLGSGLGAFADELRDAVRISYEDIPLFPVSTAVGHAGPRPFVRGLLSAAGRVYGARARANGRAGHHPDQRGWRH